MVRLTLSRPLSLVKPPTLENLQEVSDNVGSPEKPKRKILTQRGENGYNNNLTYSVPRVKSPTDEIHMKVDSIKEKIFPKLFFIPRTISQRIKFWIRGEKESSIKKDDSIKPVEWGYFVDLETVTKQHYLRNKFNRKIPLYESLPLFMVIRNPWTLTPIKEKNSDLTESEDFISESDSFIDYDSMEKIYENGLLYTIISFIGFHEKNRSIGAKLMLCALSLMTFTVGAYSVYTLNNINYGLHKHVSE